MTEIRSEEFREYTVAELIAALAGRDGEEVFEVVIQDPEGRTVFAEVTRFLVGSGSDMDRVGVYQWTTLTGRLDPRSPAPLGRSYLARDVPMGSRQPMIDPNGYQIERVIVDRIWDSVIPGKITIVYEDGVTHPYDPDYRIVAWPPAGDDG